MAEKQVLIINACLQVTFLAGDVYYVKYARKKKPSVKELFEFNGIGFVFAAIKVKNYPFSLRVIFFYLLY